ncbi:MAG: hypothetical protein ACRCSF_05595 [Mycobacteriaceae bacterium]
MSDLLKDDASDDNSGVVDHTATVWPFVAAATIFIVIIGVVVLSNIWGSQPTLTDEQQITRAVVGQNDALQRSNYQDYTSYLCDELLASATLVDEASFVAKQSKSEEANGAHIIDEVTDMAIVGEAATANVKSHYADQPTNSAENVIVVSIKFVKEKDSWKVCTAG